MGRNNGRQRTSWRGRPAPFRPAVEWLEPRCLPTTFTVMNNLDDGSAGSLRAVIAGAGSGDTINFSAGLMGQTITLTGGELGLSKNLTITGLGSANLTISGNNASRVFDILSSTTVTISGLTLTNGRSTSVGGALVDFGTLSLTDCVISNSTAVDVGGGLDFSSNGTLTLNTVTFRGNTAQGANGIGSNDADLVGGGGLYASGSGTATLTGVTFANNTARGGSGGPQGGAGGNVQGGGAYLGVSTVQLTNVVFSANLAQGGAGGPGAAGGFAQGGGLWLHALTSDSLNNVTLSGNTAAGGNGGAGPSSASGNGSAGGPGGAARGGGAYSLNSASGTWGSVLLSGNTVRGGGGGGGAGAAGFNGGSGGSGGNAAGGGALTNGDVDALTNVTITNNTAQGGAAGAGGAGQVGGAGAVGGAGDGGGLDNEAGQDTLLNCTLAGSSNTLLSATPTPGNAAFGGAAGAGGAGTATGDPGGAGQALGGGAFNQAGATLLLKNTIVANNPHGQDISNLGTVTDQGNNLGDDSSIVVLFHAASDVSGDPRLGPLQDNGGFNFTLALLPGSPAVDAGTNSGAPATDQRGVSRPQGTSADIGAFELRALKVTTASDFADGSLRIELSLANPNDTIYFAPGLPTLQLGAGLVESQNVTIVAAGVSPVTVSGGGGNFADFTVNAGAAVTLAGLTISGGNPGGNGGGILNNGTLTVNDCTVSNNLAANGAGIDNTGTLTVSDSTLSGNRAASAGGGIANSGMLTVLNCTLTGNNGVPGGGISNTGTATVSGSTLSGNTAAGAAGIANGSPGVMTIVNSTIANNTSSVFGGGIGNSGTLTITSSTIAGNHANGGIGGGIQTSGTLTARDMLLAGNTASAAGPDLDGALTSLGHNLIGNPSGGSGFAASDLLNVNPNLGPLQLNGGLTATMALLPGSPAIDAGTNAGAPAADQRGVSRPQNGSDDIGAFEVQYLTVTTPNDGIGSNLEPVLGSLRAAILTANGAGSAVIRFDIPGGGVQDIQPAQALPALLTPVFLDGTSQPGYAGTPLIDLDGTTLTANSITTPGLEVGGGNSIIRGLAINHFSGDGLLIDTHGGDLIAANTIGLDPSGTVAAGNSGNGLELGEANQNTVGGSTAADRNVISANGGDGLLLDLSANNLVLGNYFGTNAAGTGTTLGNGGNGVEGSSGNHNIIGGTAAGAGNVISANGGAGLLLTSGESHDLVQGNLIGTDAADTTALGNAANGIDIVQTTFDTVGGTSAGAGNVIAGGGSAGIVLTNALNMTVLGNFLGTDPTGTFNLGNHGPGLTLSASSNNQLGSPAAGGANVIAFNSGPAVEINSGQGNPIEGNATFLNGGPGIQLDFAGDPVSNNHQPAPVLTGFTVDGSGHPTITYTVPSLGNASYPLTVDFYVRDPGTPFTAPEGKTWIGSATYDDPSGAFTGTFTESTIPISAGAQVVATATDSDGNTSPFSKAALLHGTVFEWTAAANNGLWTDPGNWQLLAGLGHPSDYPQAADDVAIFDQPTNSQAVTIPTATTILVGEIDFSASSSYTVQALATGSLVFAVSGGHARINDTSPAATQTISAPITLDSSLDVTNTSSATLTLSGPLTETPSTVLTNLNGGKLALTGSLAVPAGETLTLNNPIPGSTTTVSASASLSAGSALVVTTAPGSVITYSGMIGGTSGSLIEQGSGKLILPASAGNTYTGDTIVQGGELEVDDLQPNSPVFITGNGVLTGKGTVGPITTGTGPGNLPGIRPAGSVSLPTLSVNSVTQAVNPTGPTSFPFTITLSAASNQVVTVSYATGSDTSPPQGTQAAPTGDFNVTSGTIDFPAGQTTETVQITAYADSTGGPEAFLFTLSSPTNATIAQGTGVGTIDPPSPTAAVSNITVPAVVDANGDTTLNFPVTLSAATNQPVTVNYTLTGYPSSSTYPLPTLPSTYLLGTIDAVSGQLTIPANSNGGTITVDVPVSTTLASPEAFALALSSPTNAVLSAATSKAVGLIVPGSLPLVSVSDALVLAARTSSTTMTFTVSLTAVPTSAVTVYWKTVDPTLSFFGSGGPVPAKSVTTILGLKTDYRAASGSLTFAAGSTQDLTQTISVAVNSSINFVQFGKYFQVQLSFSPRSSVTTSALATIGVGTALGTILYPTAQQTDGVQPDPDAFPAVLTATGNVNLDPSAFFNVPIDGPALGTGTSATGYSQLDVLPGHTVTLGGAQLNVLLLPSYAPAPGTQFVIVNNQGSAAVSGTFAGLAEGGIFSVNNIFFQITYQGGDDNDVVLTVVPPPVTVAGPVAGVINQTQTFNLSGLSSGNYFVNWGDNSATQMFASGSQSPAHVYTSTGPYTIQFWSVVGGLTGVVTPYPMTIMPATVSGVSVQWGTQGNVALQPADSVRWLPAGRTTDLPWVNINKIPITLNSAPASLSPGDITVQGINVANYGPVTVSGSGTSYTLTLARAIAGPDRVTLTIGNATIATFSARLDVLPGDVGEERVVNGVDGGLILAHFSASHTYQVIYDVNGDGKVDAGDLSVERSFNNKTLPSLGFQGHVQSAGAVHDAATGTNDFVMYSDGSVWRHVPNSTLGPNHNGWVSVTGAAVLALSAGTDGSGNADVTVQFASDNSVWTHTGTDPNSGWTKLTGAAALSGLVPRSIVAGLNGVVDVVFTNNQLWQISLASVANPTLLAGNVNFVALGVHGIGGNAVPADYVAFQDSGGNNGGVWEHYGSTWVSVTSLDAYAISASPDLSDTADLIVSSQNASGIVDQSAWGFRGTANSLIEITGLAVTSVALNAAGNDFYIIQSDGSLYEHKNGDLITTVTVLVTGTPTPVLAVYAANFDSGVVDAIFADSSLWQVGNLTGTPSYTALTS